MSHDGTALIGYDGFLFLVGGGNDLIQQYVEPERSDWTGHVTTSWIAVMERRAAMLSDRGIHFLQVIVPEKLGVARTFFPYAIPARSGFLAVIERGAAAHPLLGGSYLPVSDLLSARMAEGSPAYPRTDTHLTVGSNFALFAATLRRMGLPAPEWPRTTVRRRLYGDLSERFPDLPMLDDDVFPGDGAEASPGPELIEKVDAGDAHVGIRRVWRSSRARFPLKVVAFGNSFFERGRDARGLSWWFARFFREFHFVWHCDVDLAYVARERPDWVLAQTVERFLPVIAQS